MQPASKAVKRCVVLRQQEVDFRYLRRGDLFCLETTNEAHDVSTSEWSLALGDATEDPSHPGQFQVPAERVYFIVGKPEVSNHLLRPLDAPTKIMPKVKVGKH